MPVVGRPLFVWLVSAAIVLGLASPAQAQSTEEKFHDLFVTAGYSTAFGAALGTAFLAFKEDPSANLQFVAIGASLGFIGGSIMGSYIIFSPMMADGTDEDAAGNTLLTEAALPERRLVVRPTYDRAEKKITAIEGGMTIATF